MSAMMKEKKMWKYVTGAVVIDSKNTEDDQAAAGFILSRVEFSQQDLVPVDATAKVTWDTLCAHHEKGGPQAKLLAFTELMAARYNEGDDMKEHLNSIRELNNRLTTLNSKIQDELLATILLHSLNSSWTSVVQNLSSSSSLTFQSACTALNEEATRRKTELTRSNQGVTTALYAGNTRTAGRGHTSSHKHKSRGSLFCNYCGMDNHIEEKCYNKRDGKPARVGYKGNAHIASSSSTVNSPNTPTGNMSDMAYMASTQTSYTTAGTSQAEKTWVLDTGAAEHYCCRRDWFVSFIPSVSTTKVTVGGGQQLSIEGRGEVVIPTPTGKSYKWPAAYVPTLGVNLLSIGYAGETNHRIEFYGDKGQYIKLYSKHNPNELVIQGKRASNFIYEMVDKLVVTEKVASVAFGVTSNNSCLELWHQRLAHLNHKAVVDLFKKGMSADATSVANDLTGVTTNLATHCEACVLGKHKRSDIPTSSVHDRATRPLYRVHVDLCGPMTPARDGSLYLMLVVDDYTRFTWMCGLHSKDQAFEAFQRYVSLAEAEHPSTPVCCLRSDNGGEFLSNAFTTWLNQRGIRRELTTAHSPWQNGIVERMNRTVVEGSRTLLQDAKLPLSLWTLACYATVYCRNRSPSSTLSDSTPYELWYNVKPSHLHLRRFGCLAYNHIRKQERSKFAPKAAAYTFVGYSLDSSAYLLWDGTNVIKSRDVHFVEHLLGHEAEKVKPGEEPRYNDEEEEETGLAPSDSHPEQSVVSLPVSDSIAPVSVPHSDNQSQEVVVAAPVNAQAPISVSAPLSKQAERQLKTLKKQLSDRNQPGPADVAPSTITHIAYIMYGSALITVDIGNDTPTYDEAIHSAQAREWKKAMDSEINSLIDAGTFTVCKLPPGFKAIGGKWVLKIKRGAKREIVKFKARFVAQGFLQRYGVDYVDTYAPVARIPSIRIIIALAAHYDWELHHMDVKSAYLNGDLEEEIYMYQPEGYVVSGDEGPLVWKLHKSLYGLKQAGRTWNIKIDVALKKRGFKTLPADLCIYVKRQLNTIIVIALYVDDLLIASNHVNDLIQFKKNLAAEFKMDDLGKVEFILGIKVIRDRTARTISISQAAYVTALLDRHDMSACKSVTTPMETSSALHQLVKAPEGYQASDQEIKNYQSMIGGIMYAMLCTRPDISFAVTTLSQFSSNPLPSHVQALKHVLRYLKGTVNMGITYTGTGPTTIPPNLIGYSDADWGQSYDRRSVTGYVFELCGGAISWQSKKQRTVALSTVEAEYMAITHASKEAIWWRSIFNTLGYDMTDPTTLWSDSQGSISLAANPEHHSRTKHIDIQYHFIRQHLAEQTISLQFIASEKMAADGLTKSLDRVKHEKGMKMLGMNTV